MRMLLVGLAFVACAAAEPALATCYPGLGDCADDSKPAPMPLPTKPAPAPAEAPAESPASAPAEPAPAEAPAASPPSLLERLADGEWAVGAASNCGTPAKTYTLTLAPGSESITWRNGKGETDVEKIEANSDDRAVTVTLRSKHRDSSGERPGTSWTYTLLRSGKVSVQPGGRNPFTLVRCE